MPLVTLALEIDNPTLYDGSLLFSFARYCRPLSIECNVLPQANGSARVRLESGYGQVLASVKMELMHPESEDMVIRGAIECDVECWASDKLTGRDAADLGAELSETLKSLLVTSKVLDAHKLVVVPGKWQWHVAIDVCILEGSGGSLVDLCAVAAVAALRDTRLPRLKLIRGETKADVSVELNEDHPDGDTTPFFAAEDLPIILTLTQIGGLNVLDSTTEEEASAASRIVAAVDRGGNICSLLAQGEGGIAPSLLHSAAEGARRFAPFLFSVIDDAVAAASTS